MIVAERERGITQASQKTGHATSAEVPGQLQYKHNPALLEARQDFTAGHERRQLQLFRAGELLDRGLWEGRPPAIDATYRRHRPLVVVVSAAVHSSEHMVFVERERYPS